MDGIIYKVAFFMIPPVSGDDLVPTADYNLVDVAPDQPRRRRYRKPPAPNRRCLGVQGFVGDHWKGAHPAGLPVRGIVVCLGPAHPCPLQEAVWALGWTWPGAGGGQRRGGRRPAIQQPRRLLSGVCSPEGP